MNTIIIIIFIFLISVTINLLTKKYTIISGQPTYVLSKYLDYPDYMGRLERQIPGMQNLLYNWFNNNISLLNEWKSILALPYYYDPNELKELIHLYNNIPHISPNQVGDIESINNIETIDIYRTLNIKLDSLPAISSVPKYIFKIPVSKTFLDTKTLDSNTFEKLLYIFIILHTLYVTRLTTEEQLRIWRLYLILCMVLTTKQMDNEWISKLIKYYRYIINQYDDLKVYIGDLIPEEDEEELTEDNVRHVLDIMLAKFYTIHHNMKILKKKEIKEGFCNLQQKMKRVKIEMEGLECSKENWARYYQIKNRIKNILIDL